MGYSYKEERDLTRTWIHVDMDMFYAAVAVLDDPTLKDVPFAVGDLKMIATSNYEARKFGVRSAMPGFVGKNLCPKLRFVPNQPKRYKEISAVFFGVLREYDPEFESMGLDEANLDVTDYLIDCDINDEEGRQKLSSEIRKKVFEATKLTCSAGISCNRMLAKICSDLNKPDGQYILPHDSEKILKFVTELNIRKIPGVGRVAELELNELGINK
jgi:DNA polymerase kappa